MFTWKAYYYNEDLSLNVYSSENTGWEELPSNGMICLIVKIGRFLHKIHSVEKYWLSNDRYGLFYDNQFEIYKSNDMGSFVETYEPIENFSESSIKHGELVSDDIIDSIEVI